MIENFFYIIGILFWIIISLFIINHIESRIFFISRMKKKYDIIKPLEKQKKDEKIFNIGGFIVWGLFLSPSLIIYPLMYIYSKIMCIIMISIVLLFFFYYMNKYKKYDILEYIDYYSADMFDWDKVYELNIDEDIKRKCFTIHNKIYDNYKEKNKNE